MTKLEKARKDYIQVGVELYQCINEYNQAKNNWHQAFSIYKEYQSKKELDQAWDKFDQALDKYRHTWRRLLKLEIKHILATKISI